MCKYCNSLGTAKGNLDACVAPGPAVVCLPPAIDNYNPCQNSPYAQLPERLRKTLGDTFTAIQSGTKDSEGYALTDAGQLGLQGTFKGARIDTWDALDGIDSFLVNVYRLIYDRVQALMPSLWDEVRWIRWCWISTSMGFNVTYRDPAAAKSRLNGATTSSNANQRAICFESRSLSWVFHKDCDCWRELPTSAADAQKDAEGLHILVGDRPGNQLGDSIHIDPIDPYKFKDEDGTCIVKLDDETRAHLLQVFCGKDIYSPFRTLPPLLDGIQKDLKSAWATGVDAEKAEVKAIADSWAKEERSQAVLGRPGWRYFQAKVDRLRAILQKLDTMRPASAAPVPAVRPQQAPPPASPK